MDISAIVNQRNTIDHSSIDQVRQMIDTELDQSLKLSNSFCGPTYMSVNYEGCRPNSETMVWTVKLAHGAQHYEYRLLEGDSAPICVIRDVNDPQRSRAVDFSGPDHDEVMRRMDEAVKLVTGMQ